MKLGQQVRSKKGNGTITNIITKSTGYVEVTLESGAKIKVMAFLLTDMDGNPVKKAPKQKEAPKLTRLQSLSKALVVNVYELHYGRNDSSWKIVEDITTRTLTHANHFPNKPFAELVANICNTVLERGKCSEKQAYYIAKFAIDNGVEK